MAIKKRIIWKEWLRIISAFVVVLAHSGAVTLEAFGAPVDWLPCNFYSCLARFSVPVFLMISGSFVLDPQRTRYDRIPWKNLLHLLAALFFWSVAYLVARKAYGTLTAQTPIEILKLLLYGYHHFWYLWMMIGLYLATPLLRKFTTDPATAKKFLIFSFFAFLCARFLFLLPYFSNFAETYERLDISVGVGCSFYFVAGYYLDVTELSARARKLIYLAGTCAFLVSFFGTYLFSARAGSFQGLFNDNLSPFIALFSLAVYVFFRQRLIRKTYGEKSERAILYVSGLTFGIYLAHELSIMTLSHFEILQSLPPIVGAPIRACITVVVCGVVTAVIKKIPGLKNWVV